MKRKRSGQLIFMIVCLCLISSVSVISLAAQVVQGESKIILTSAENGIGLNEVVLKENSQGEYDASFHIEWKDKLQQSDLASWRISLKEVKDNNTEGMTTSLPSIQTPLPQKEVITGKIHISNKIAKIDQSVEFTSDNLEKAVIEFEKCNLNEVDVKINVSKNVAFTVEVSRKVGQEVLVQEIEIVKMPEATSTPIVTPTVYPTATPTAPPVITASPVSSVSVEKVSGLKVSKRTTTSVTLTWNAVSNATKYRIYYVDNNKKDVKLCDVTEVSKKISKAGKNLTAGTGITFKVAAYNITNGRTTFGAKRSLTCTTQPSATKIIRVSPKSKSSIQLILNKKSKVNGYHVVYSTKKSSGYKKAYLGKNRMVTVSKLSKKTYYFKVRTYKLVGTKKVYSKYSTPISYKMK